MMPWGEGRHPFAQGHYCEKPHLMRGYNGQLANTFLKRYSLT